MARSTFTLFSALAVIASTALQASAYTYLGCVNTIVETGGIAPSTQGNVGKCAAYCGETSDVAHVFYFKADGEDCVCSDTTPASNSYVGADSTAFGACNAGDYGIYSLTTTFDFQGCYSNMVTDENPGDDFANLESCLAACADKGSVMFNPYANNNAFGCRCNSAFEIDGAGNEVTCGTYTWYNYVHSRAAAASGLARRNLRARLEQLRLSQQTYCPHGNTACAVDGSADTYECIDTKTELESCGGCLYGEYKSTSANATVGTNCADLPGVSMGAATCTNSVCHAYACKSGFELASGVCVLTASA